MPCASCRSSGATAGGPRLPAGSAERRIVVTGRVQGVGYRWFARHTAGALGVNGWVRNMPDGSVLLEVAASGDTLDRFATALREGPPGATVVDVRVSERTDPSPLPDRFLVVR